ncbi:uncharacterized protein N7487_012197 [Penicillium crustosum]|uniref:uncharacterized protein n=1 Tax=Penicillium crustosum TaxID=36656 RepID=UPI002394D59E|nr:uncharacterized protein N7487_012197 [Penicillium crustosum]KAJ5394556.1 hypothetical protein N7487_012197 [Penicillium crustosum]
MQFRNPASWLTWNNCGARHVTPTYRRSAVPIRYQVSQHRIGGYSENGDTKQPPRRERTEGDENQLSQSAQYQNAYRSDEYLWAKRLEQDEMLPSPAAEGGVV